jgi:hypothetical protein
VNLDIHEHILRTSHKQGYPKFKELYVWCGELVLLDTCDLEVSGCSVGRADSCMLAYLGPPLSSNTDSEQADYGPGGVADGGGLCWGRANR